MGEQLLRENILRTLLYYDIFSFPLKPEEVYLFLQRNSLPKPYVLEKLKNLSTETNSKFASKDGYIYVKPNVHHVDIRIHREDYSRKMWLVARFMTHIIKRFPFIRAVFVTGSLSKNSSDRSSDLDYMIVTKSGRLWIARTLLMLFKKVFLFNSYKFFCLNYFISEDNLEIPFKNVFTATEVAHIKSTFNTSLMNRFVNANLWVRDYFPNYRLLDPYLHYAGFKVNNRRSVLQKLFELPFGAGWAEKLDNYLREKTSGYWKKKYGYINEPDRNTMFRTEKNESTVHPGNMQKTILALYKEKLKQFNLNESSNG